jgi:uncharacterized protein (DUF1778 family)
MCEGTLNYLIQAIEISTYKCTEFTMKATARIEMRCKKREKELLNRAAATKGMRTTAFIRELALEQARHVIDQAERIELGESSYQRQEHTQSPNI